MQAIALRRVPEQTVIDRYLELFSAGKHAGKNSNPVAERFMGIDPMWVEVEIPHDQYNADWNTDGATADRLSRDQIRRAITYSKQPGELPPGMATFNGRSNRAYVSDGNHRAYASYLRGKP